MALAAGQRGGVAFVPATPSSARSFAPRRVVTSSRSCAGPSSMTVATWSPDARVEQSKIDPHFAIGAGAHYHSRNQEQKCPLPKLLRAMRSTSARRSVSGLFPRSVRQRATSSAGMACSLPLAASSDVSISANAVCSQASVGVFERSRICRTATDLRRIVFSVDCRVQNQGPPPGPPSSDCARTGSQ